MAPVPDLPPDVPPRRRRRARPAVARRHAAGPGRRRGEAAGAHRVPVLPQRRLAEGLDPREGRGRLRPAVLARPARRSCESEVLVLSGLDKRTVGRRRRPLRQDGQLPDRPDGHQDDRQGPQRRRRLGRPVLAAKVGRHTPLPSLELGIDPVISGIDATVGYTRLYGSYISWRDADARRWPRRSTRGSSTSGSSGRRTGRRDRSDDRPSLLDLALEDAQRPAPAARPGRPVQARRVPRLGAGRRAALEFAAKPPTKRWEPVNPAVPPVAVADAAPASRRTTTTTSGSCST